MRIMAAAFLITLFSIAASYSEEVNAVMKDGVIINGNLLGITANEVFIESANGKAITIEESDLKGLFDASTGNEIKLAPMQNAEEQKIYEKPVQKVYRYSVPGPKNAVSIDFAGLLMNYFRVSWERSINDLFSIKIDASYSPDFGWNSGVDLWSAAIYGRLYFWHQRWMNTIVNGLTGPYLELGAGCEQGWMNYSYSDWFGSYSTTGNLPISPVIRFGFGDRILFGTNSGFFLEPHFGWEYLIGNGWNLNYSGSGPDEELTPFIMGYDSGEPYTFGIDFGYAF